MVNNENPYLPVTSIKVLLESPANSAACPKERFSLSFSSLPGLFLIQFRLYSNRVVKAGDRFHYKSLKLPKSITKIFQTFGLMG
ncbi:MAG: hypothetical protein JWQ40_3241 [Segetibacter sp.]|nr:hypothetical protein [Segetibacter sp.]